MEAVAAVFVGFSVLGMGKPNALGNFLRSNFNRSAPQWADHAEFTVLLRILNCKRHRPCPCIDGYVFPTQCKKIRAYESTNEEWQLMIGRRKKA